MTITPEQRAEIERLAGDIGVWKITGWTAAVCDLLRALAAQQAPAEPMEKAAPSDDEAPRLSGIIEALKQAHDESLEGEHQSARAMLRDAIADLETVAAQQAAQQAPAEPVAWCITDGEGGYDYRDDEPEQWDIARAARYGRKYKPLYTAPPAVLTLKPLTEAQAVSAAREAGFCIVTNDEAAMLMRCVRLTEAAHGITAKEQAR